MKNPTQCILWKKPELVFGPKEPNFEQIETYEDDDHLKRRLFKCRECGQLYFYEFYEEIDWENGNDPAYRTYIPVETKEEIALLKKASVGELLQFTPRLQDDWPADAETHTVRWIRGEELPNNEKTV